MTKVEAQEYYAAVYWESRACTSEQAESLLCLFFSRIAAYGFGSWLTVCDGSEVPALLPGGGLASCLARGAHSDLSASFGGLLLGDDVAVHVRIGALGQRLSNHVMVRVSADAFRSFTAAVATATLAALVEIFKPSWGTVSPWDWPGPREATGGPKVGWFYYVRCPDAVALCAQIPAFRKEPIGDGFLVQCVEGQFDPGNAQHVQRVAATSGALAAARLLEVGRA